MTSKVQRLMYRSKALRITSDTVSPLSAALFCAACHKASSTRTLREGVLGALGIVGLFVSKFIKLIGALVGAKANADSVAIVKEPNLRFSSCGVNLFTHPARFVVFNCVCSTVNAHFLFPLDFGVCAGCAHLDSGEVSNTVILACVKVTISRSNRYNFTVQVVASVVFASRAPHTASDFKSFCVCHHVSPFHQLPAGVGTPYALYLHPVNPNPKNATFGVSLHPHRKEAA